MNPFDSWPVWLRENFGAVYALCALSVFAWLIITLSNHIRKTGRARLRPPFQYNSPDHGNQDT